MTGTRLARCKTLLVYLYVGDTFVNAKMLEKGYAYASPMPPNTKYDEHFAALEPQWYALFTDLLDRIVHPDVRKCSIIV